jgi:hypothetical protein
MKSRTVKPFWSVFRQLPPPIRLKARAAYARFRENSASNGLYFKQIAGSPGTYSARVDDNYRVLGRLRDGEIRWFFIGDHDAYMRWLRKK